MRKLALIALLTASLPAAAATPYEKLGGTVGSVEIAEAVEVPLYTSSWGAPVPCVVAEIGGRKFLLALSTAGKHIYLSEEAVTAAGSEPKEGNKKLINLKGKDNKFKYGHEIHWAKVDSIQIGGMEIVDAKVLTDKPEDPTEILIEVPDGARIDGMIGLGALEDYVAYSILPSQGVVRFGPAEAGAGFVSALGGAQLPYHGFEGYTQKFRGEKGYVTSSTMIVEGLVDTRKVNVLMDPASYGSMVSGNLGLKPTLSTHRGDRTLSWHDIEISTIPVRSEWMLEETALGFEGKLVTEFDAAVGSSVLGDLDIAVDPTAGIVALSQTESQTRKSPVDVLIADKLAAMQEAADEAKEGEEKEGEQAEAGSTQGDKPIGAWGDWMQLVDLYRAKNDVDKAIEAATNATVLEPSNCDAYDDLGALYGVKGDLDQALAAFEKQSELYHAWWDIELKERKELEKEIGKLEGEEKEDFEYHVQPASCDDADGNVALVYLAKGNYSAIEELYRQRLDLDPTLALAWANAALLDGKAEKALEPLRQSTLRHRRTGTGDRLGLALYYQSKGDLATAEGHYKQALDWDWYEPRGLHLWLDSVEKANGTKAALEAARALSDANPERVDAVLALARIAKQQGDAAAFEDAKKRYDRDFAREAMLYPTDKATRTAQAEWAVINGDLDAAARAADEALAVDFDGPAAYVVKAEVAARSGDAAQAQSYLEKAAQLYPEHIGYAVQNTRYILDMVPAPAPEPTPEPAPVEEKKGPGKKLKGK